MPKQSVYIETTVVSYLTARPTRDLIVAAHQQITVDWWDDVLPLLDPYVSPIVLEECSRGDEDAAARRLSRIRAFGVLQITDEVLDLADRYFARIDLPDKARGDAVHLAVATYHGMDFLASWNFAHILSPRVGAVITEINTSLGISTPAICTPEALMEI